MICNPTVASDEKTDSFPFPLSSKIHNPMQVTVIFGWCSQKFAYPEDKPCVPCPEVVSGLQQRSNIWSSADCWVDKSFSYWKKKTMKLRLPEGFLFIRSCTLFYWSCSHSLSISVMIHFSFRRLDLGGVGFWDCLLWSWLTCITVSSCSGDTFPYKGPASLGRSFWGCEGPQDEPQIQAEGEACDRWLEHCWLVLVTPERCLMSFG